MSWTHRVVKEVLRGARPQWRGRRDAVPESAYYTIREIYTSGLFTEQAAQAGGETLDELKRDYERQGLAFTKPVLVIADGKIVGEEPGS